MNHSKNQFEPIEDHLVDSFFIEGEINAPIDLSCS